MLNLPGSASCRIKNAFCSPRMSLALPMAAFAVLFCFASCSKGEPRILYGFIDLIYYPGAEIPQEKYSFFALCEDDDGVENLSELCLYHDLEGLRWVVTCDDWVQHEEDGKTWVGSRSIAMPEGLPLPRGQFRAVLTNKGGEKTEKRFAYDGPIDPRFPFPFFSITDGIYRVDSRYPVNRLICYDQHGNPVQTHLLADMQGNIRDLRLANTVRTIALWAEDSANHVSAITDAATVAR